MKKLLEDNSADIKMIGAVVGILVTIIISVLIFYNIAGSIDTDTADDNIADHMDIEGYTENFTDSSNSTDDILSNAATFYQIAPIIAIVIVAVVILGYVSRI